MSKITQSFTSLGDALRAVHDLTDGAGREWCTTNQVAQKLETSARDAVARLGFLDHRGHVKLIGSTSGYERKWKLTDEARAELESDEPEGWEGTE